MGTIVNRDSRHTTRIRHCAIVDLVFGTVLGILECSL